MPIFFIELLSIYFWLFECSRRYDSTSTTTFMVLHIIENAINDGSDVAQDDVAQDDVSSSIQGHYNKDDAKLHWCGCRNAQMR